MEEIVPIVPGEIGNTKNSISPKRLVKPQGNARVYWFFTWNNYGDNFEEIIVPRFKVLCKKYSFQEETGENGTKHLQGSIELIKKMRWTEFKLPKEIHWEPTRNVEAANNYCLKEDTCTGKKYTYDYKIDKKKLIKVLKPWQQKVVDMISLEPDDRTINWVYDEIGCMGKTVFSKYLAVMEDAVICTGGGVKDIACLLNILVKNGRDLDNKTTFIMNIPRSSENISYAAIESVKDGLITNVKYESSTLIFNCPHVFIFSNELPDVTRLSKDRWNILTIKNDELVKYNINDISNDNPLDKI